jgi:hypothetical protein
MEPSDSGVGFNWYSDPAGIFQGWGVPDLAWQAVPLGQAVDVAYPGMFPGQLALPFGFI